MIYIYIYIYIAPFVRRRELQVCAPRGRAPQTGGTLSRGQGASVAKQKCTRGIWRQDIVLKHRNSLQKSLCPVVMYPSLRSSEINSSTDRNSDSGRELHGRLKHNAPQDSYPAPPGESAAGALPAPRRASEAPRGHEGVEPHASAKFGRLAMRHRSYTILYYTILYYTILYYTIPYYTILYYTILYYTILYYTLLYFTLLYFTIPYLYHNAGGQFQRAQTGVIQTLELCSCRWHFEAEIMILLPLLIIMIIIMLLIIRQFWELTDPHFETFGLPAYGSLLSTAGR